MRRVDGAVPVGGAFLAAGEEDDGDGFLIAANLVSWQKIAGQAGVFAEGLDVRGLGGIHQGAKEEGVAGEGGDVEGAVIDGRAKITGDLICGVCGKSGATGGNDGWVRQPGGDAVGSGDSGCFHRGAGHPALNLVG